MNYYKINKVIDFVLYLIILKVCKKCIFFSIGSTLTTCGLAMVSNAPGIFDLLIFASSYFSNYQNKYTSISAINPYLTFFTGLALIIIGVIICLFEYTNRIKFKPKVLLIKHSSMAKLNFPTNKKISKDFKIVNEVNIDLRNKINSIPLALKKQDQLVKNIETFENYNGIAYLGVAHLPFIFRLGYLLGDEKKIYYFEKKKSKNNDFKQLMPLGIYPPLHYTLSEPQPNYNEIAILIGITFPILIDEIPLDLSNIAQMNFEIKGLRKKGSLHDIIMSDYQLNTYKELIRTKISILIKKQQINKIHIFYAGPVSLALALGSMFSPNNDPEKIINYHYDYNNPKKYIWGIDIKNGDIIQTKHIEKNF